jgi:hypothetical protein
MRVILQSGCRMQRTTASLRNVYCGPGHIQSIRAPHIQTSMFIWTYLRYYWRYFDNSMRVILQTLSPTQRTSSSLRNVYCGPGHIQSIYSSSLSGHNIQLNLTAQLLQICRHLDARCSAIWVPNSAHHRQFTQCVLWSRTYTKYLQLRIFRLQYSTERICAAIGDISTIPCAL